jgi:hypothetical protein
MRRERAEGGTQVMEHRELPRIGPGEQRVDAADENQRPTYLPSWLELRSRQLLPAYRRRMLAAALVILAIFGVLGYLSVLGGRAAVSWLHRQPQYQLPFREIHLEPEPPAWFRGSKKGFLEGVRRESRESAAIPLLDLGPAQLAGDFKNYPWVEDVKVRYVPGAIYVRLHYRQPVAYVQLGDAVQMIVDENGTILPDKDVDETCSEVKSLVKITGDGLLPPADPRPGVTWKSPEGENDPRILAAAKLAGFLRKDPRLPEAQQRPALHVIEIIVSQFDRRGLFVMNAEAAVIWWKRAPGEEAPGEPSAAEKWAILRKWAEAQEQLSLPKGDFWAFSNADLVPVCAHPGKPHVPEKGPATRPEQASSVRKQAKPG